MIHIPEKYFWPGLVVAILSLSVGANIVLIIAARSDGGAQIIDNYYEKAAHWDDHQAELKRVRELGWTVDILVGPQAETRPVRFIVKDRDGVPVQGLRPNVVVTSPAKLAVQSQAELTNDAPGIYAANLDIPHPGLWDFEFTARLGDGDFITKKRVEVPK